jgi:RNase P/RNase MRP subunit p30
MEIVEVDKVIGFDKEVVQLAVVHKLELEELLRNLLADVGIHRMILVEDTGCMGRS